MSALRNGLVIVDADRTLDGRLRVVFSDRTCCVVSLDELLSVGVFHADSVPSLPFRLEKPLFRATAKTADHP